jgi:hypothetical protein
MLDPIQTVQQWVLLWSEESTGELFLNANLPLYILRNSKLHNIGMKSAIDLWIQVSGR